MILAGLNRVLVFNILIHENTGLKICFIFLPDTKKAKPIIADAAIAEDIPNEYGLL